MPRPAYYRLASGGWRCVQSEFELLNKELDMVMQLAGTRTVDDAK
jgi:L-lactate oxidase